MNCLLARDFGRTGHGSICIQNPSSSDLTKRSPYRVKKLLFQIPSAPNVKEPGFFCEAWLSLYASQSSFPPSSLPPQLEAALKQQQLCQRLEFPEYQFLCPAADVVHGTGPGHGISSFQVFRDGLRSCHLGSGSVQAVLELLVNLCQISHSCPLRIRALYRTGWWFFRKSR